jgi:hypothetical protein
VSKLLRSPQVKPDDWENVEAPRNTASRRAAEHRWWMKSLAASAGCEMAAVVWYCAKVAAKHALQTVLTWTVQDRRVLTQQLGFDFTMEETCTPSGHNSGAETSICASTESGNAILGAPLPKGARQPSQPGRRLVVRDCAFATRLCLTTLLRYWNGANELFCPKNGCHSLQRPFGRCS